MDIATLRADTASAPQAHALADVPVPNPLPKLLTGEDLPSEDSEHLFERLVLGRLEPAEIAGMLIALRMKGETADEMIGAARALSAAALPFTYFAASTCGSSVGSPSSASASGSSPASRAICALVRRFGLKGR